MHFKLSSTPICLVVLVFLFAGCQTVRMPTGPDVDHLTPLDHAPLLAVCARDHREKDRIGMIGGTSIMVPREDASKTLENYIRQTLYQAGINSSIQSGCADVSQGQSAKDMVSRSRADGLLIFNIQTIKVGSVDLLLDPPHYELESSASLYMADGKLYLERNFFSSIKNQSIGSNGQGKAVASLMEDAAEKLRNLSQFNEYLKSIQHHS